MRLKKQYLCLLVLLISGCMLIWPQVLYAAASNEQTSFSDIQGHWAEKQINDWVSKGLVSGYSDGTYKPDNSISRAELFALVNSTFGYTKTAPNEFSDVAPADWFAGEVAKAAAIGYAGGYTDGTIRPLSPISRQEVATILSKIMALHSGNLEALNNFTDKANIPRWSQYAVCAAVASGYMKGYPDGSFQPEGFITRAEAISVLDRAAGALFNKAGISGPAEGTATVNGNATISASDVILKNTVITGNLYLTEGIGEGRATLDNVVVKGATIVKGGGTHSIIIINSTLGQVTVEVPDGSSVRLVTSGSSSVGSVTANSDATLEEDGVTGPGFVDVIIPRGAKIQLSGQFESVAVEEADTRVSVVSGSVNSMTISREAAGSTVTLGKDSSIAALVATVNGQGNIGTITVNSNGATVTQNNVTVGGQTTQEIGSLTVIGNSTSTTAPSSGGNSSGGGDGGSGGDKTAPTAAVYHPADNSANVAIGANLAVTFSENVTAVAGKNIFIRKSSDNSTVVTIPSDGPQVTIAGAVVTINPAIDLDNNIEYYVEIEVDAFKDSANNAFAGISGPTTWNFTTGMLTQATPTFSPAAGAVAFGTELQIISAGAEHIYYTTNGDNPATSAGGVTLEYSDGGRPVINTAMTVKAVATRAGYDNSVIGSAFYTQAATADLAGLALSGSPANYTFAGGTYTYNGVTVANSVYSITVAPTGAGIITVDGTEVSSGAISSEIPLTAGTPKTITVVAAETGKTSKTYTVTVTRLMATQTATADLTNIVLSGTPANYAFAGGIYTYNGVTVANSVYSITVTPTGAGTITVDGTEVTSGAASAAISLTAGTPKTITVVATETGKSSKTYNIIVTRSDVVDVQLTGLTESLAADFSPAFAGGTYAYTLAATSAEWTVSITPTLAGATITWDVDTDLSPAAAVASGAAAAIPLLPGENIVTVHVEKAGTNARDYVITVTMPGNVRLAGLTEDLVGDLGPALTGGTYTYTLTATNTESTVNITPILAGATITWDINTDASPAAAVTLGTAATIPLAEGYNTITIHVEKAGANAKDYAITVIRSPSIGEIAGGTGSYNDGDTISFGKTFSAVPVVLVNACDAATGSPLIAGVRTESGIAPTTTGFTLKLHDLENNPVTSNATVHWVAINPAAFGPNMRVQARYDSYHYNGEYIAFANPFADDEISALRVICCAYDSLRQYPILAAPYGIDKNGFTVSLRDADGQPSEGSVWYIALVQPQWVGYYDEVSIISNYQTYLNAAHIGYYLSRHADAIICSAQGSVYGFPNHAYAVAARNNSSTGFDLGLLDYDGNAPNISTWTSWIAFGFK